MDNIIVVLIVIAAVIYMIRRFKNMFNPDQPGCIGACGCSCSGMSDGSPCGKSNLNIRVKPSERSH